MTEPRFIAIDWSGAAKGERRKIWLAETRAGKLIRLEGGRTRPEIAQHLIEEATRDPDLVVGFDFAFSFPAWFLCELGLASAVELWQRVGEQGEAWLRGCEAPFWGRPGRRRPALPSYFRLTEESAQGVAANQPKSVFQIGGAGAVGTGSVRGMPVLAHLARAGFSIWPFDSARRPFVIEIYPRLLTGGGYQVRSARATGVSLRAAS